MNFYTPPPLQTSHAAGPAHPTRNHRVPHHVLEAAIRVIDQPAAPSLREILGAYRLKGDGDREMLLAILAAKTAEDQRIAETVKLHSILASTNFFQDDPPPGPFVPATTATTASRPATATATAAVPPQSHIRSTASSSLRPDHESSHYRSKYTPSAPSVREDSPRTWPVAAAPSPDSEPVQSRRGTTQNESRSQYKREDDIPSTNNIQRVVRAQPPSSVSSPDAFSSSGSSGEPDSSYRTSAMSIGKLLSEGERQQQRQRLPHIERNRPQSQMELDDEELQREEVRRYMEQRRPSFEEEGRPIKVARRGLDTSPR